MDRLTPSAVESEARSRVALVGPDGVVRSFGDLADEVSATSPPSCVAFVATPTLEAVVRVYAHLEHRVPFVPLHPKWLPSDAEEIRARAGVAWSEKVLHDHTAVLLATSGSSGPAKLARITRANLLASAHAHELNLPFVPEDRWLLALPFAHAGGLSILTRCLAARSTVVLAPSFDVEDVLERIARSGVTLLSVVPTALTKLLDADRHRALSRLRAVLVGGAPFPAALRARAQAAGVRALATYGLTETISQIATASLDDAWNPERRDSGRPLAGVNLHISTANGPTTQSGIEGEILVRGEVVFDGYVGAPPRALGDALRTGDRGKFDSEGRLVVLGRLDDLIITGGENVHPTEVEAEVMKVAGVREVVVFGMPDSVWGEVVSAALVLTEGIQAEEVVATANGALPTFRRIRKWLVLPSLPTNAMGKLSRREVKDRCAKS